MNIINKSIFFVVVFITLSIQAQRSDQLTQPFNTTLQEVSSFISLNNYSNVDGLPYVNKDFKLAKIEGFEGSHLVRFNFSNGNIELKQSDSDIISLSKKYKYIITFQDGSGIYETQPYIDSEKKIKNTIFQRISTSEKFSLFKRTKIDFTAAIPQKSGYEPAVPASFSKPIFTYYLMNSIKDSGNLIEIPKRKKKFLRLFDKKSGEMATYIKSNKLQIDSEQDLIQILNHYFGLIS